MGAYGEQSGPSRRTVLRGGAALGLGAAVAGTALPTAGAAEATTEAPYLVGRGMGDTTGACAENGMMGYSMPQQIDDGISMRLRARAFVIVDRATGKRIAWCVADQALIPVAAHAAIVAKLMSKYPGIYDYTNVCVTATHSHSTPGGCSHDFIYNLAILGFQQETFDAMVDGYVDAISAAHDDLKPGSITVGHTTLTDASRNRSQQAFELNPDADKAVFPDAIDPHMIVWRFTQGGTDIGAISWFPTHGTSLPNTNLLVSGDNKGYAAWAWEREQLGQDYLAGQPAFVSAFAQSAAGDMSPNLELKPGTGPTDDPWQNFAIIGDRQKTAMQSAWKSATEPISGSIDSIATYIDIGDIAIDSKWTPDGQEHHTTPAVIGASMLAGSVEDGPGLGYPEGWTGPLAKLWAMLPTMPPAPGWMLSEQQPKLCTLPVGLVGAAPSRVLIQVLKIGQFHIACTPCEVTIVAGLRIRRSVAATLGVPLDQVMIQSYSNGYAEYVTTPEEYASQQYEGGSTLYGRYELCAYQQELSSLAAKLQAGASIPVRSAGAPSPLGFIDLVPGVVYDNPPLGKRFGQVVTAPAASYKKGTQAQVVFVTGHPKNNLRRGSTFLEVQRKVGAAWQRVQDDGDFATKFTWKRTDVVLGTSTASITWDIPADAPSGTYRIVHHGSAKASLTGKISDFTGASTEFTVS
ncbi:neutral/alkaline ceramidase [Flexivirga oryzae]|uniref:Neutral ceramidase n=1 Tax=Flexivirga oryzae TaxID=1794944 RepID=A0A839N8B2_9MICO|nr:neutral/alkaline ceramidase [Flexivirga oryzae]MBB2894008.1 neutral ceramidase [Flexivirga oryzae]